MTRRVLLVAGVLWVFLDVFRMWAPSLITIFGKAAETPAELIGAFALACGALPLVLLLVTRSRAKIEPIALGILLLSRIGLAFTDGGQPQLWLASLGLVAGAWWLSSVLGRDARLIAPGIAVGLALAVGTHIVLGTYGAVWRRDVWGWSALAISVALVAYLHLRTSEDQSEAAPKPHWQQAWFVFPALLFAGVYVANAGRASTASEDFGLLALSAGLALGVAAAFLPVSRLSVWLARGSLLGSIALLALVEVDRAGIASQQSPWALAGYVVGVPALIALLKVGTHTGGKAGARTIAAGAILWVILLFVYYAGYDMGYRADVVLVAAVVLFGQWRLAPTEPGERQALKPFLLPAGLAVAGTAALAVAGPALSLRPIELPASQDNPRIVAYNVRMGYGMDGRFEAEAVAKLLAKENADVILLSEVDRGWLLNGGQDQLRIIASLLGMHASFGPAADPVWGDAILSRAPQTGVHNQPLTQFDAYTGAQALLATIELDGQPVTFISTHLQTGPEGTNDTQGQADELAELMSSQTNPTVMGGDLNTTPDSGPWRTVLGTGFSDALAPIRPAYTWSAEDPSEEIDHIFLSPSLVGVKPRVVRTTLSDHLPVFVDLDLQLGPQR